MDCKEFRERLDLYVDGELSAAEAAEAGEHLKGCASCARAEAGLRRLKASLKRVVRRHQPPDVLESNVLRSRRAGVRRASETGRLAGDEDVQVGAPFWRANVVVPVPLLAVLLLCLVALAGWLALTRRPAREEVTSGRPAPVASPAPPEVSPGGFDFSRYYGGERASIRVVRRASLEGAGR